jgi:nucleotide-binding universal stress UspA family protein
VRPAEYRTAVFEGALFGSGRPVLMTPPDWNGETIGKRILVAWNGKRESARALADAMPFLESADHVILATIDAKPDVSGVGPAPGADIAAHLARHGVKVELRNLDGLGGDAADMLIAEARASDADLIVMGGYGRPRLSEYVFGGVTRTMAAKSPVPVLMSH